MRGEDKNSFHPAIEFVWFLTMMATATARRPRGQGIGQHTPRAPTCGLVGVHTHCLSPSADDRPIMSSVMGMGWRARSCDLRLESGALC